MTLLPFLYRRPVRTHGQWTSTTPSRFILLPLRLPLRHLHFPSRSQGSISVTEAVLGEKRKRRRKPKPLLVWNQCTVVAKAIHRNGLRSEPASTINRFPISINTVKSKKQAQTLVSTTCPPTMLGIFYGQRYWSLSRGKTCGLPWRI